MEEITSTEITKLEKQVVYFNILWFSSFILPGIGVVILMELGYKISKNFDIYLAVLGIAILFQTLCFIGLFITRKKLKRVKKKSEAKIRGTS